jgi:hypothetical protein
MAAAGDFNPTRFIAGFQRILTAAADMMPVYLQTCASRDLFNGTSQSLWFAPS